MLFNKIYHEIMFILVHYRLLKLLYYNIKIALLVKNVTAKRYGQKNIDIFNVTEMTQYNKLFN